MQFPGLRCAHYNVQFQERNWPMLSENRPTERYNCRYETHSLADDILRRLSVRPFRLLQFARNEFWSLSVAENLTCLGNAAHRKEARWDNYLLFCVLVSLFGSRVGNLMPPVMGCVIHSNVCFKLWILRHFSSLISSFYEVVLISP